MHDDRTKQTSAKCKWNVFHVILSYAFMVLKNIIYIPITTYFYIYILFLLTAYDIELPPKCKVGPLISDQKHVFWRRFLRKCIYVKPYYIIIILLYISFKTWTLWILVGQWTTISTQNGICSRSFLAQKFIIILKKNTSYRIMNILKTYAWKYSLSKTLVCFNGKLKYCWISCFC